MRVYVNMVVGRKDTRVVNTPSPDFEILIGQLRNAIVKLML